MSRWCVTKHCACRVSTARERGTWTISLQAGGIGLLNAVERYDALQGTAFTTYAVQRIRGAMLDELRSRDWVPRSVRRNAREVAQAIGQLEQELGRNATETEVAERLGDRYCRLSPNVARHQ